MKLWMVLLIILIIHNKSSYSFYLLLLQLPICRPNNHRTAIKLCSVIKRGTTSAQNRLSNRTTVTNNTIIGTKKLKALKFRFLLPSHLLFKLKHFI